MGDGTVKSLEAAFRGCRPGGVRAAGRANLALPDRQF
jgi:hypothetical protein